jgi:hypothetical protein
VPWAAFSAFLFKMDKHLLERALAKVVLSGKWRKRHIVV